jgi:hypothetical protein
LIPELGRKRNKSSPTKKELLKVKLAENFLFGDIFYSRFYYTGKIV